ncbi:hypothetical protein HispidOSU_001401 [Sigmodon hispidus]
MSKSNILEFYIKQTTCPQHHSSFCQTDGKLQGNSAQSFQEAGFCMMLSESCRREGLKNCEHSHPGTELCTRKATTIIHFTSEAV